jgi:hypothetical protein
MHNFVRMHAIFSERGVRVTLEKGRERKGERGIERKKGMEREKKRERKRERE